MVSNLPDDQLDDSETNRSYHSYGHIVNLRPIVTFRLVSPALFREVVASLRERYDHDHGESNEDHEQELGRVFDEVGDRMVFLDQIGMSIFLLLVLYFS